MGFNPLKSLAGSTDSAGIEMFGNERIVIFDCKYVVDYSKEKIVVNLGSLNLKICGFDLVMSSFAFGQTEISGELVSVEFEKNI